MLKKEIRYTDFNGVERMKTYYFNIGENEIMEMEVDVEGGYAAFLKSIVEMQDARQLVAAFKQFILKAVGLKSDDGESFIKTDEVREAFSHTAAFQALFIELTTDANAAAAFVTGVMPKKFTELMNNQQTLPMTVDELKKQNAALLGMAGTPVSGYNPSPTSDYTTDQTVVSVPQHDHSAFLPPTPNG